MSDETSVLTQYVPGFRANLNLVPQQMTSRLLGGVDADLNYSEAGEFFNADDLGTSDPEEVTTRVPDTPDKFLGFTKRVGAFRPFQDSAWLDNVDKARMLEDPSSKVMSALMAGRWRRPDSQIIAAALGNAMEKEEDGTYSSVALPATQVIAANDADYVHDDETIPGSSADYGMGVGKLIHASLLLDQSEIEGPRFCAMSAKQRADLLRSTAATSMYYQDVKAMVSGQIDDLLGFKIIRTERLLKAASNRRCIAWVKPALVYKGRPITNASIRIRHDKSDTPQAFYKAEDGAVRRYDTGVVEILAKEP